MRAHLKRLRRVSKVKAKPPITLGKNDYLLHKDPCKNCGKPTNGGTALVRDGATERKPRPGDLAICLFCGHAMAYADRRGRKRELTDDEIVKVAGDPALVTFNTIRGPALAKHERDRTLALIDRAVKPSGGAEFRPHKPAEPHPRAYGR